MFDVGHGQGSFDWEIAEICVENGFHPDIISTDLHSGNVSGLARDLPWVMSKFLHLGMISNITYAKCKGPKGKFDLTDAFLQE